MFTKKRFIFNKCFAGPSILVKITDSNTKPQAQDTYSILELDLRKKS
jgi:hypothetical protein